MARILFLTPYLSWPPDHGGRIRSLELLRALAPHHDVVNVSGRAPEDREEAPARLEAEGVAVRAFPLAPRHGPRGPWQRVRKLLRLAAGRSDVLPRFRSERVAEGLRAAAREGFDLAILDHLWMAAYRPELGETPLLLSTHNVESALLARKARSLDGLASRLVTREAEALARIENRLLRDAAATVVVSGDDAERLRPRMHDPERLHVVPNGVALASRPFLPPAPAEPPRLLYVGGYDYAPNLVAARRLAGDLLPRLRATHPDAEVHLVGRDPEGALRDLAALPGVHLTGRVEDLLSSWKACTLLVAPLVDGGGSRLKILEAFAVGRAVVTTPVGAEGLAVEDGRELRLAASDEDLIGAIRELLDAPAARNRLRERARDFVASHHDWPTLRRRFREAVEQAVGRRGTYPD